MLGGALVLIAGFAMGQVDGERPPRPPNPLVAALDVDGDGQISAEEIAGASEALLALDANADGALTQDELRPPPPPDGAGPEGGDLIADRDSDGDGVVSFEEFVAPAADAFAHIDANGDGVIDSSEAAAAPPPPRQGRQEIGPRRMSRGGK